MKKSLWLAGILIGGAAVCTDPASPCACEPQKTHVLVYGTVHDAGGAPLAGASVFVEVLPSSVVAVDPVRTGAPDAVTSASGYYRVEAVSFFGPTSSARVVVGAIRAPADTVRGEVGGAELRPRNEVPDSVSVDLRFP